VIRRLKAARFASAVFAFTALSACADGESGSPHPTDRLDFPVSATADPSGRLVWVVSGNFDLAWRGAGILAIDVLENRFVPELAFEIGNFPGALSFLEKDGRAVAGYLTSREEDSLYTLKFGGDDPSRPTVSCTDGKRGADDQILHCPSTGTVTTVTASDDTELTVGDDPYASLIAPKRRAGDKDLLVVGGLADGKLATLSLAADGTPTLDGNFALGKGLVGLARNPATGRLFASSKLAASIAVLDIARRPWADDPDVADPVNPWLALVSTVTLPEQLNARDRARALAISADGTRLYATYRAPDSLVILDIADDGQGNPRNRVLHRVSLADDPNDIEVVQGPDGTELLYVSCFRGNRIEVIEAKSGVVLGSVKVGLGPSDMAVIDRPDLGVRRLYVALFNANAVGVVELDPASPYYHTEIAEIR
jgi:DNA-binding beta-propeller fold protein YncE